MSVESINEVIGFNTVTKSAIKQSSNSDVLSYFPPGSNFKNEICLIMIVRDEGFVFPNGPAIDENGEPTGAGAPVVCRAFESVINLIDSFVLCDTGSNDKTIEIMKDYMEKHGKSGYILHKEWEWFGPTKSYLMKRAYTDNLSQNAKYLCWLDADEMYLMPDTKRPPTPEDKIKLLNLLDADPNVGIFYLHTHFYSHRYWRWNIVRNDQLYSWGPLPVQEALEPTRQTGQKYTDFMYLLARKQGHSSRTPARAKGELVAMTEFLSKEDPKSTNYSRGLFYLGEILGYNNQPEESVKTYRKRADMNCHNLQEDYISLLRMGRTLATTLKRPDDAVRAWIEACTRFPTRIECFYELLMNAIGKNDFKAALMWARKAPAKSEQNANDMFVESDIANWKFYVQASCAAYYADNSELAYFWAAKLLKDNVYPPEWKEQILKNYDFCERKVMAKLKEPDTLPSEFRQMSVNSTTTRGAKIPHAIIIDNFYDKPDEIRNFALSQPFEVKGNYPGFRTKSFANEVHKALFEKILGRRITYWPEQYNGSFQYTIGTMRSWVHRDATDYAAVIYLTPDAPIKTGTTFFRHKNTGREYEDATVKKEMDDASNNMNAWDVTDVVSNKYNRLILFNGKRSHMSTDYFGDSKENGRLFQTFFFNIEVDPSEAWTMTQERPPKN